MLYELVLMKFLLCQCSPYFLFLFEKMSAAFIGMYEFDAWDISHEFMIAYMKDGRSSGIKDAMKIEKEFCETLYNIQNSFHSAVNAFTALERKHDEIVGKIKPGRDEIKLYDHIVRIIVLLKR